MRNVQLDATWEVEWFSSIYHLHLNKMKFTAIEFVVLPDFLISLQKSFELRLFFLSFQSTMHFDVGCVRKKKLKVFRQFQLNSPWRWIKCFPIILISCNEWDVWNWSRLQNTKIINRRFVWIILNGSHDYKIGITLT